MAEITIVRIEGGARHGWEVYFSEPVCLPGLSRRSSWWWAEIGENTDRLAAYQWGLGVIKKHEALVRRKAHGGDNGNEN